MFELKAKRLYFLWTWMLYWKPSAHFTGLDLKYFERVYSGGLQQLGDVVLQAGAKSALRRIYSLTRLTP